MNKRKILVLIALLLIIGFSLIFGFFVGRNDARMVMKIPSGFISLKDAAASSESMLRYVFWESQISFLNSKDALIYQTSIKDNKFIVKFKGEYYINAEKYQEILHSAKDIE